MDTTKPDPVQILRHDLKSPVSTIKWFCEILKDEKTGKLNERQVSCIEEIEQANEKALKMIDEQIREENLRKVMSQ